MSRPRNLYPLLKGVSAQLCTGKDRQILSGIAKYYKPEELVGKTVVACTNLAPRKMMGRESNGMLISAEQGESLHLLMLDDAIPAGAKLC